MNTSMVQWMGLCVWKMVTSDRGRRLKDIHVSVFMSAGGCVDGWLVGWVDGWVAG